MPGDGDLRDIMFLGDRVGIGKALNKAFGGMSAESSFRARSTSTLSSRWHCAGGNAPWCSVGDAVRLRAAPRQRSSVEMREHMCVTDSRHSLPPLRRRCVLVVLPASW